MRALFGTVSATAGKTIVAMATVYLAVAIDPRAVATACQQIIG